MLFHIICVETGECSFTAITSWSGRLILSDTFFLVENYQGKVRATEASRIKSIA